MSLLTFHLPSRLLSFFSSFFPSFIVVFVTAYTGACSLFLFSLFMSWVFFRSFILGPIRLFFFINFLFSRSRLSYFWLFFLLLLLSFFTLPLLCSILLPPFIILFYYSFVHAFRSIFLP